MPKKDGFMEKGLSITKSNSLIEAGYRLSLTEMQIILYGISLINPLQKDFPLSYQIEITRFSKMLNRDHGNIYKEIKEAVMKRFWNRDFSYTDEKGKIVTLRWLTKMVHEDKSGYIEIKFSEEIQPYLHQLQGNFTSVYINQIARFKSVYSVRFYEYSYMVLNKNKSNQEKFSLSIEEIKKWLNLEDSYQRFCDFNVRVLEKSKNEINKFSDLNFKYRVIKLGRSPNKIEFSISKKNQDVHLDYEKIQTKISTSAFEKAKEITLSAKTGWDIYAIEQQFYEYMKKVGAPKNLDAAFIGFVKKKVADKPN